MLVQERADIDEVVGDVRHLALRRRRQLQGALPLPRREDRRRSRSARASGSFHCFGCGEGGDVIAFVSKIDHLTFAEAVERLAGARRHPAALRGGRRPRPGRQQGQRTRLVDAHAAAAQFYAEQLDGPEAADRPARSSPSAASTRRRPSTSASASRPQGWDALTRHLRGQGLHRGGAARRRPVAPGQARGSIDRFRGRLLWPIRDISRRRRSGSARAGCSTTTASRPKYLNTPETPIYKKSQVLYGVDLAKREIAASSRRSSSRATPT